MRIAALLLILLSPSAPAAGGNVFSVSGSKVLFNGQAFKVVGLRTSNALISDASTQQLINNLAVFKSYGVNTVSVFFMGSRFGDVKGYRPDASLDPTYAARMGRIIQEADTRGMIVLVGCLYWSTSRAKENLGAWGQAEANKAVANTVRWLRDNNYRNVFVDPDNEGMAHDAKGWSISAMIDAAHAVDPKIMVGYNDSAAVPSNADLYMHHSPKVPGKPWIESEGAPSGYWGAYSKETHDKNGYYNYSRIGRYTADMKSGQISKAKSDIGTYNGYMMASTWLQCGPAEGVGGPFQTPGGRSNIANVNATIDTLHPDAGILWWLEAMRAAYGAWTPPTGSNAPPTVSLTSPSNGSTFAAPANLTLGATASDPNGTVTKVEFFSNGALLGSDPTAPFSFSWNNVPAGTYTLTARATDNLGASTASSPVTITVTGSGGQSVAGFTLVNADADSDIGPLADGATINLATTPTRNLNIRANTSPATVGSVKFAYDGNANYRTENTAPYAIAGDTPQGNYNPWTPAVGTHALTAAPYSGSGATGTAGTSLTVRFTVVDQPGAPMDPAFGPAAVSAADAGSRDGDEGLCGTLGIEVLLLIGLAGSFSRWLTK